MSRPRARSARSHPGVRPDVARRGVTQDRVQTCGKRWADRGSQEGVVIEVGPEVGEKVAENSPMEAA